jgi:molecular chaperone DnaK
MEACAHILYLLRLVAQRHVGHEVKDVLLTTPVSFVKPQYEDLRRSAELAGLTVVDFVDEPTAASLSNLSDEMCRGLVAVYDFGGGTFDFTVTEVSSREVKVVTTAGDTWLGGDDLDEVLAAEMSNAFWRQYGVEIRKQAFLWQRLLVAAEQAKRDLSEKSETVLSLSEVAMTQKGPIGMRYVVTRSQFSQMSQKIIAETMETCRQAMDLAGIKVSDLSAVYLSGGTCYVPAVREAVARFFKMEPRTTVPPERSVLVGAVLHGAGVEVQ